MDDFMKTEAKDIISTAIEKASGATGINVEVRSSKAFFFKIDNGYSLHANS